MMATKAGSAEVSRTAGTTDGEDGVRRRDFLNVAAVSFAGVGAVVAIAPLLVQMAPSADFVAHLTPKEIAEAQAVPVSSLRDPETLQDRTHPGHLNWLIVIGVCTHLGCIPLGTGEGENRGPYDGYFCPCHGSQYDTAARIRAGPAPRNLVVPDYKFETPTTVLIGAKG